MIKIGNDTKKAGEIIRNGGLVIFPTETVYGLGANALDSNAVKNIFLAKERPTYDPLIVHIHSTDMIDTVVSDFPDNAKKLADKFWPGPLTLILPKSENIPFLVTSNLDSVGVRIPSHPATLKFLKYANVPVAGPSANKFGYISPTKSTHLNDLESDVDYILEGGECEIGLESTIVSLIGKPTILRKGRITKEEIESIVGEVEVKINSSSRPEAPGMLEKHYAPKSDLEIYNPDKNYKGRIAFLSFGDNLPPIKPECVLNLSEKEDLLEAAENLYSFLRELDSGDFDLILTKYLPDTGVGQAINDKLKRATAK